jgi:hypothetical protein
MTNSTITMTTKHLLPDVVLIARDRAIEYLVQDHNRNDN